MDFPKECHRNPHDFLKVPIQCTSYRSIYLSIYLSIHPFIYLSNLISSNLIHPSIHRSLSLYFSLHFSLLTLLSSIFALLSSLFSLLSSLSILSPYTSVISLSLSLSFCSTCIYFSPCSGYLCVTVSKATPSVRSSPSLPCWRISWVALSMSARHRFRIIFHPQPLGRPISLSEPASDRKVLAKET